MNTMVKTKFPDCGSGVVKIFLNPDWQERFYAEFITPAAFKFSFIFAKFIIIGIA